MFPATMRQVTTATTTTTTKMTMTMTVTRRTRTRLVGTMRAARSGSKQSKRPLRKVSCHSVLEDMSTGDWTAAAMWSFALYYVSPLQLLLLFLGRIETERPSDWVMRKLADTLGMTVNVQAQPPLKLQAAAVGLCVTGGLSVAITFNQLLYDPTWSISTGIGALMAVLVYEIGRPKRLSLEEVERREALSADFMTFVEEKLSIGSMQRCHVSDLQKEFLRWKPMYRIQQESVTEQDILRMVRMSLPEVKRTKRGFLKGIGMK